MPVPAPIPHEDTKARRARRARRDRRRRVFGFGILATFAVVLTIVTATVFILSGMFVHYTAKSELEDELGRRLEGIAALTADALAKDYGYYTRIVRDGPNASARKNVGELLRRVRASTGVRDVLLMTPDLRILLRASDPPPVPGQEPAPKTEAAAVSTDEATIRRALGSGLPVAASLYWYPAEGKYYKSAYAPVVLEEERASAPPNAPKDKSDTRLVVGVDLPADFAAAIDRVDRNFVLLGVIAGAVVLLCAVYLVQQRVHVPIYRLVRAMEGDSDSDEPKPPVKARVRWRDEIGALTDRYNSMVERLQRQDQELRRLYAEAREHAEFLRGYSNYLVEGVPTGVVSVDPTGRVTVWNEAAARILGREPEKAVGRAKDEALGKDHPVAKALGAALTGSISDQAIVAIGQAGDAEAGEAEGDDAGARLVELAAAPIHDEKGALLGAAALVNDRTELERLRRSATRNERLAAVGRLAAGLAHEIRNPLGAISGFAELLERKDKDKKEGEAARLAARLRGEVDELNRFVTEFLGFARDSQIKRAPTELNLLVRRAAETALGAIGVGADDIKSALDGKPIAPPQGLGSGDGTLKVELELDPALEEEFPLDPTMLRSAVVNIAKNALEAMHGRGTLTLKTRRTDDRASIRIRDTGPGIPPELREKIFDPFFTTKDKGVGLGLAIAHKAVVAHGGKIHVRVPDGGGCEFVLRIPAELGASVSEDPERSGHDLKPVTSQTASGSGRLEDDSTPSRPVDTVDNQKVK